MTPQEFKESWNNLDEPLSPLTPKRLERFGLLKSTTDFLTIAGLPVYAEPDLSFANDSDDMFYGINKLTEQYDFFQERKPEFEKYIVIGSCRDGDAIAINTDANDQIEELDHGDFFSSMFFNSSISTLAGFLILYRDFEKMVVEGKDVEDNFRVYNFSNEQFEELKNRMLSIDRKAVLEKGFWKDELDIMLSIREEYFGK